MRSRANRTCTCSAVAATLTALCRWRRPAGNCDADSYEGMRIPVAAYVCACCTCIYGSYFWFQRAVVLCHITKTMRPSHDPVTILSPQMVAPPNPTAWSEKRLS